MVALLKSELPGIYQLEADWFDSAWITSLFTFAVVTLVTFVWWEFRHPDPIVNVRLFQRRNFATAMVFTFALGIVLYGTTFVIPQFLQSLLGYSAVRAGEAISGGGLISRRETGVSSR